MDYPANSFLAQGYLVVLKTIKLDFLGQQMELSYFNLFLIGVTAQLNDFHTVPKSRRNGLNCVSSYNPKNIGQVEGELDKVVAEGMVLLRVQHL